MNFDTIYPQRNSPSPLGSAATLAVAIAITAALGCNRQPAAESEAPANPEQAQRAELVKALKQIKSRTVDIGEWQARKDQQFKIARKYDTFFDFQFTDEYEKSGITFQQHIVEDSGKYWKPVHYDHGSGVASADVDGDGLLDLYFVSQLGENELWRSLGQGKFENITASAGVALADKISVAPAFGDIDNDGDPDLFVTTVKMGNHLFENLGDGRFQDISATAGVDYVGHSSGALFFDYDRDGLLDLFVTNIGVYTLDEKGPGGFYRGVTDGFSGHLFPERTEYSLLYHNEGDNRFREVSKEVGLVDGSWSGDASICDLNHDGWPDLYVLNMQGDDHFYENQAGKQFVEKIDQIFPKTPWGAMGIKFFDFDLDEDMDLYLTDMHSDMTDAQSEDSKTDISLEFEKAKSESYCGIEWTDAFLQGMSNNVFGNAFYVNRGDMQFEEVSDRLGVETYWPWGLSVFDLNADGYEDVFVTGGMGYTYRYGINSVLLNEHGERFFDAEYLLGVEPRLHGRTHKHGFTLYCSGVDRDHPMCEGQIGRVKIQESLSSRSSVILDLDQDGDLDIITNDMDDRPQILFSNLTDRKDIHWLKLKLVGTQSNRDAIGSLVKVYAGDKVMSRYVDGNSSYLARSLMPLYFGLGEAESIDKIEIQWASGQTQEITPEGINRLVEVEESKG